MILVAILGWALLVGADPRRLVILGVTLAVPWTLLPLIAWSYFRPAPRRPRPAMFCETVASELRSGATLTQALVAAGRAVDLDALVELHRLGATARDMGRALAVEFGEIGRELAVAVDATSRSGAPSADLFDEIGSLALAQSEIAHEVRVASAPARATVLIFVAAPTLYLAQRLSAGGLVALVATSAQRSVTLAGLGLFVAGLAAVITLVGRVR